MTASNGALELRGVTKRYGTARAGRHRRRPGQPSGSRPEAFAALTGPSGRESPRCCTCSARSTGPTPAPSVSDGPTSPRGAAPPWSRTGAGRLRVPALQPAARPHRPTTCSPPCCPTASVRQARPGRQLLGNVGLAGRDAPCRRSCPVVSSSGSPSRAHWSTPRRCCSPTSPPATSTPPPPRSISRPDRLACARTHMTVLVATHDAGVAASADRVVRLRDGQSPTTSSSPQTAQSKTSSATSASSANQPTHPAQTTW